MSRGGPAVIPCECGSNQVHVLNSEGLSGGALIRRRRHCMACGARFNTFESRTDPRTLGRLAERLTDAARVVSLALEDSDVR